MKMRSESKSFLKKGVLAAAIALATGGMALQASAQSKAPAPKPAQIKISDGVVKIGLLEDLTSLYEKTSRAWARSRP